MRNRSCTLAGSFVAILAASAVLSCSCRQGTSSRESDPVSEQRPARGLTLVKFTEPAVNSEFKMGTAVTVKISPVEGEPLPDSVQIYYDGIRIASLTGAPWELNLPGRIVNSAGRKSLKISAYHEGTARTVASRVIIIMAAKTPVRYTYMVLNSYPHDKSAFTQGLFYHKGFLYEGTGQEASSSLREVELETGKVVRQLNLGSAFFGEGIALAGDKIFQLTWRSKVGFVYDLATFRQLKKVYYQTEGWGLTTMGENLLMSDGTNVLYIIEPETFTVTGRIEVYDDEKKVDQLNELEYINGEIWANIWMTDLIARIDPASGTVTGYVDLRGILRDRDTDTTIDVLNGIAHDSSGDRIFVTGKNWPRLFEIRVTE